MVYPYPTDKPLPKLPVTREAFCTQEMTDAIIGYIEEKRPQLIEELYEKCQGMSGDYFTAFFKAAEFTLNEVGKTMEVPDDPRGYIDLTFELCRRLRTNMELPPFEVVGNPIAPDINGPYMSLAKKEIREKFLQYGFTQAALDDVMERYYKDWPIKWYLSGEGLRRAQGVFIKQQAVPFSYFEELIRQKIQIQEVGRMLVHDLQIEATDRLRLMCNIPYGR
jgi:hypothetical protein